MSSTFFRVSLFGVRSQLAKIQIQFTRTASTKAVKQTMPLFVQAEKFKTKIAVIDQYGPHRYDQLVHRANRLTEKIGTLCEKDTDGANIAILCPHDVSYVISQWSCWITGSAVVPLSPSHPESQLHYFLSDSEAKLVIYTEEYADKVQTACKDLDVKHLQLKEEDFLPTESEEAELQKEGSVVLSKKFRNELADDGFRMKNALIIYTSGTTGRPKGVVHTFGSLHASIDGMASEWAWSEKDVILHVLPLHHVHGIVNCLMTPLYIGATCVMIPKFHPHTVWQYLLQPPHTPFRINVFMAVPTIYVMLIREYEKMVELGELAADTVRNLCSSELKLMVSGSSALPIPVLQQWQNLTGHVLLERYGMTETLMVLTNPYNGTRTPGAVGHPFPGVDVCIVHPANEPGEQDTVVAKTDSDGTVIMPGQEGVAGKLYVKGSSLFKEYYNRPEATEETFTMLGSERWFETGDTACYKDGSYKILGRTSVDIIKHGGYKISALEIERIFLEHAAIEDIAVVGLPDTTYGETIAAVIASKEQLSFDVLHEWALERMPAYWVPKEVKIIPKIPKNIMGKVNKKELVKEIFSDS